LSETIQQLNIQLLEKNLNNQQEDSNEQMSAQINQLKEENAHLKASLQDAFTESENKVRELNDQLSNQMIQYEESQTLMVEKHLREIDTLNAEMLTIKENGSLPNQTVLENREIKGDTILQTKHEHIVCDKCYSYPLFGTRFKHLDG